MIRAAKQPAPEPLWTIKNPDAEISDAAIDALANLLLDCVEREDQET